MKYVLLSQRSPEYDEQLWQELDDLYTGGYKIVRNAERYLPQLVGENPLRYRERCRATGYIGYVGQILDYYVSVLFSQQLTIHEAADADDPKSLGDKADPKFYPAFAHDADLKGHAFAHVLKHVVRDALLKRRGLMTVDFPTPEMTREVVSRADEEALGTSRAYVDRMPVEELIDWGEDEREELTWAILYRSKVDRKDPESVRDAVTHEWKLWEMQGGFATWTAYRAVMRPNDHFQPDQDIPEVASGRTTFRCIPIRTLRIPEGLWIGNKLGTLQKEHFQRRSALVSAENRSVVAIPVLKRGPEITETGGLNETQENPHRGRDPVGKAVSQGWVELGSGDTLEFVEPIGAAYKVIDDQLKDLKDEMFRVVHQMAASVDNSSSSMRRSGDSKKEDRSAESIVIAAIGLLVRDFAKGIYDTISMARDERVVWTPHGLDDFDLDDRSAVIAESVQVDQIPIPSPTFVKLYKSHLALKLVPNCPPETQATIQQEIEDGVDEQEAHAAKMRNMALAPPLPDPVASDEGGEQMPPKKRGVKPNGRPTLAVKNAPT